MDLRFGSVDLQQACNREAALVARWGRQRATSIAQRLQELDAVERLGDMELLSYVRVRSAGKANHVIVEDNDGVRIGLALDLEGGSSNSEIEWEACRAATIVTVVVEEE
ncbi:MAG TPA: hypothetical protein VF660_06990 [Actinomycetota bacterium]